MTLTEKQQKIVEENLGLVGKVIKDKVHGANQLGIFTYEDLFQIGCLGLCRAAATDKGGCFSTYAYRLIWNSICDALIYATKRQDTELPTDDRILCEASDYETLIPELKLDMDTALQKARDSATPSIKRGIDALILLSQEYSSAEVGQKLHMTPGVARAMASKARKYLRNCPEMRRLNEGPAL